MPSPSLNENSSDRALRIDPRGWTCIELLGDDREEWLQGQATNDIRLLKPGQRLSFCLCEPTGGLLAVIDAWALEDRILLTTARELESAVLDRVERMTILEDVSAVVSPMTLVSIQGEESRSRIGELVELPDGEAGTARYEGETVYLLRSRRTSVEGWDLWLPDNLASRFAQSFKAMPEEDYEGARIQAGIPKWGVDMGPKTLPPELGRDFESRHISYQKGCYTGQEVLMRIHSRGHTNRTLVGLISETPLPVGSTVELNGKSVGTVSSTANAGPRAFVAASILRNEAITEGQKVMVGDVEATVRRMPFDA